AGCAAIALAGDRDAERRRERRGSGGPRASRGDGRGGAEGGGGTRGCGRCVVSWTEASEPLIRGDSCARSSAGGAALGALQGDRLAWGPLRAGRGGRWGRALQLCRVPLSGCLQACAGAEGRAGGGRGVAGG